MTASVLNPNLFVIYIISVEFSVCLIFWVWIKSLKGLITLMKGRRKIYNDNNQRSTHAPKSLGLVWGR